MEPLSQNIRDALKREHPGLSDETIDRVEALLSKRFAIDPEVDPLAIAEVDRQRAEILKRDIPRYEQVIQRIRGLGQAP